MQVNLTETGVEVILETAEGQLASPVTSVVGNALIADIPNAMLALPEGEEFQAASPAEGIALVAVTSRADGIRVAITGTERRFSPQVHGCQTLSTPITQLILFRGGLRTVPAKFPFDRLFPITYCPFPIPHYNSISIYQLFSIL